MTVDLSTGDLICLSENNLVKALLDKNLNEWRDLINLKGHLTN